MSLEIKYVLIPVINRDESVEFYTGKLGFKLAGNLSIRDNECPAIRLDDESPLLILEEVEDLAHSGAKTRLVLNTEDCLRDYHKFRTAGIQFEGKPEYLSVGLSVRFADPSGNLFTLFEQRDYFNN